MPKYVIEREIPGAGKMSPQDLQEHDRSEVLRRAAKTGAANSVGAQLRHRRQNLLRLYRAE